MEIRALDATEVEAAAHVLSRAMLDNPIHIAVLRGAGEEQRAYLARTFAAMLTARPGEVIVAEEAGRPVGVLRSYPCPDQRRDGAPDPDPRIAHWHAVWAAHDPDEPHRHLGPLGVLPAEQGRGTGTELMDAFSASIDTAGEAAYLETDKALNVGFYERHGFAIVAEADIFGVRNYFMWREARD